MVHMLEEIADRTIPIVIPSLQPGATWTGTAGTGWTVTPAPVDPVRTTAKPAMHSLIVERQVFNDSLMFGVIALANNEGTLIGGVDHVRFYMEGKAVDVSDLSYQTITDANGEERSYLGYWVKMKRPEGATGAVEVYAEAVPADTTMQSRVMGPYTFFMDDTYYEYDLVVDPNTAEVAGSSYQEITDAVQYLKTVTHRTARITVAANHPSGRYSLPSTAPQFDNTGGWLTIEAAVPITLGSSEYVNDTAQALRPRYSGVHLRGSNITIDTRYGAKFVTENGDRGYWFDGVNVVTSGGTTGLLVRKGKRVSSEWVDGDFWVTECVFDNVGDQLGKAQLARGCSSTNSFRDCLTHALCVVDCVVDGHNNDFWQADSDAMTVTGPAGATLDLVGGNDASSRTFTAKVNGVSIGTFKVGNTYALYSAPGAGEGYNVQDVVDWINGLGVGWSATLIDDSRRASSLSRLGTKGVGFTGLDVSTTQTLTSYFDNHGDFYQHSTGGPGENVIVMDCVLKGSSTPQVIFLTKDNPKDMIFVNILGETLENANKSQFDTNHSHVVLAHISLTTQDMTFLGTYTADAYCLVANCNVADLDSTSGSNPAFSNIVIDGANLSSGVTGVIATAGSRATKYVDPSNGNFTLAGELLTNLVPPVWTYALDKSTRGTTAPVGSGGILLPQVYSPYPLQPGPAWDGTAGSGWAAEPVPVDPARTTAKPTLHVMTPPNQWFTDTLTVGVQSWANSGGTLIGGVDHVAFIYEGSEYKVFTPTLRTFQRRDGEEYEVLGYWVDLKKPQGLSGDAQLYIEAVPSDVTMQSRVLGPLNFCPVDTLHDYEVTVTPSAPLVVGENYHEVIDAMDYMAIVNAKNPRILVTENHGSGFYSLTLGATTYNGGTGRCNIEASVPVVFGNPTYTTDGDANFRMRYAGVKFAGPNITIDAGNLSLFSLEESTDFFGIWMDKVHITDSRPSPYWRGGTRPSFMFVERKGVSYFTDCESDTINDPWAGANLARGCKSNGGYNDFAQGAHCVTHCSAEQWNSTTPWQTYVPAMTVQGPALSRLKTLEGNEVDRTLIAVENGVTVSTFLVDNTAAAYEEAIGEGFDPVALGRGYFISDVVAWLNSLPGWTASVLDDERRATALATNAIDGSIKGIAFDVDVSVQRTFETYFDVHTDFLKQVLNENVENVLWSFNKGVGVKGQVFFVTEEHGAQDWMIICNAVQNEADGNLIQMNVRNNGVGAFSHVVIAHNSVPNQEMLLRTNSPGFSPDGYCLFGLNAMKDIYWSAEGPRGSATIKDNLVDAGSTGLATATGTVVAGTSASKFPNMGTGDFTAAGEAASNLKSPVVIIDVSGELRSGSEPIGAVGSGSGNLPSYGSSVFAEGPAAPPAPPPPPPPPPSVADFTDAAEDGGVGYQELLSATSARAYRDVNGFGRIVFDGVALPPGTYNISGTISLYDGAGSAPDGIRLYLKSGFTSLVNFVNPGPFTATVTLDDVLRMDSQSGRGFRIDDLSITAV